MKRKLKKLEQVLAENPGWYTDDGGVLSHKSWENQIHPFMIEYFGKSHDFVDGCKIPSDIPYSGKWTFNESWFEKPEKKKLYAYKVQMQRPAKLGYLDTIIFSEIPDEPNEQRVPWYDIEYGDK